MLIGLSGLPGVGKTSIANALARATGATYLRIDSIEQALRNEGLNVYGEGYAVAYAVAEDNLRLGRLVIADCVDPWPLTRRAWEGAAGRAGARILHVELVCSDSDEHRRRVEGRQADIPGHQLPTWEDVLAVDYRPWDQDHLVIDTARRAVAESVEILRSAAGI